ncbi:hypothetical protein MFFDBJGM_00917 [Pectobacterium versatile]|nr:putative antitoxin [Pectobacterium versatile]GBO47909.1 hypothetical protein MFFDBJGM_00917 [Pectobacterium versatile]
MKGVNSFVQNLFIWRRVYAVMLLLFWLSAKFSIKYHTEKGLIMSVQPILANAAVSISDFKKSPNAALKEANGEPVAVLTNGRISGYYVSPETWEALADYQEDIELAKIARSRMKGKRVKVDLDEL